MWNDLSKSRSTTSSTKWVETQPSILRIEQHFTQHFLSWLLLKSLSKTIFLTINDIVKCPDFLAYFKL